MNSDFVFAQLRTGLLAIIAYGAGSGWFTPQESTLFVALITAFGPLLVPILLSVYSNWNTKKVAINSVAAAVAVEEAKPTATPNTLAAAAGVAAMKTAALVLFVLLILQPAAFAQQRAVGALVPVDVRALIVADLTAARDDAKQFSDPSELCWATLLGHANSMPVKLAGVAHTVQRLRDLRRGLPKLLDDCAVVKDGARQALLQIFGAAVTGAASLTALGF